MKELKINRAIKCLYVVALVQLLSSAYIAYLSFGLMRASVEAARNMGPEYAAHDFGIGFFGPGAIWSVLIVVAVYFVTQDLKKDKWWAWAGGLAVLLMSAPSWALPASVIGIISLLDEDVRVGFLEQMDIKI